MHTESRGPERPTVHLPPRQQHHLCVDICVVVVCAPEHGTHKGKKLTLKLELDHRHSMAKPLHLALCINLDDLEAKVESLVI